MLQLLAMPRPAAVQTVLAYEQKAPPAVPPAVSQELKEQPQPPDHPTDGISLQARLASGLAEEASDIITAQPSYMIQYYTSRQNPHAKAPAINSDWDWTQGLSSSFFERLEVSSASPASSATAIAPAFGSSTPAT
eukprot:6978175-Pyramimonas_sp.AAC.2